jgi:hypothetical protein
MSGGIISGNTAISTDSAAGLGGGVYVETQGTFKKGNFETSNSGTIYGNNAQPGQPNTATGDGQAVYVVDGSKKLDDTAWEDHNLDSTKSVLEGGWYVSPTSADYIQARINGVQGNTGTIDLPGGEYTIGKTIEISSGKDITITTKPGVEVTLKRTGFTGDMFMVTSGKLTLRAEGIEEDTDGLFLDGGSTIATLVPAEGSLVNVRNANLTIQDGATLQNNNKTIGNGGGVYFDGDGTFAMEGGIISGNKAAAAGGVYFGGTEFTMGGSAKIIGNEANSPSTCYGGGVYVASGIFKMSETAEISGNKATGTGTGNGGGGVYASSNGSFTMSGGTIGGGDGKANSANNGGGVYVKCG